MNFKFNFHWNVWNVYKMGFIGFGTLINSNHSGIRKWCSIQNFCEENIIALLHKKSFISAIILNLLDKSSI